MSRHFAKTDPLDLKEPTETPKAKGVCVKAPLAKYKTILNLQRKIVAAKINKSYQDEVLLLLEHPAVFTLGYRGGMENLLVSEEFLKNRGVQAVQTERGGNITYHAPGQLVAYPIVELKAARLGAASLVEALEEVMIKISDELGVRARRKPGSPGVWTKGKKLGSVGVAIRRGISFHGLALNVNISLEPFGWINPCGFQNIYVTSLSRELGEKIPMPRIYERVASVFQNITGIELKPLAFNQLTRAAARE